MHGVRQGSYWTVPSYHEGIADGESKGITGVLMVFACQWVMDGRPALGQHVP